MPLWSQGYAGTPAFLMYPDGFVAAPTSMMFCLYRTNDMRMFDSVHTAEHGGHFNRLLFDFYTLCHRHNLNWSGSSPMGDVVAGVRVQQTSNEF